jgi:mannose/cellobiose epimerase-like protein (N-acyl-D-glucosamine 2-epimerase family)
MKERCYQSGNKDYKNYGGRGIKVCDRWRERKYGFWNFIADMGEKPVGTTLDRIDNNGNYEPSNCRWATQLQQKHNTRPIGEHRGVDKRDDGWYARIDVNRKRYYSEKCHSLEDAMAARKKLEATYL